MMNGGCRGQTGSRREIIPIRAARVPIVASVELRLNFAACLAGSVAMNQAARRRL